MGSETEKVQLKPKRKSEQGLVASASLREDSLWVETSRKGPDSVLEYQLEAKQNLSEAPLSFESPFPLPEEPNWSNLQRALGMARGKILKISHHEGSKVQGVIEIDGHPYALEDLREEKWKKLVPLKRFHRNQKEISFTFWPTLTAETPSEDLERSCPVIRICHLRKHCSEPGTIEIVGAVEQKASEHFLVGFQSMLQNRKFLVSLAGSFPGELGARVRVLATLKQGSIHFKSFTCLKTFSL